MKVFYSPNQATEAETTFSPSARKPKVLVEQWQQKGKVIEVVSDFEPVTRQQYYRVHEQDHVDAVLDCRKDNGFNNRSPEIAATLPWTSGSLLAAATEALHSGKTTMSPTSGFHHATMKEAMGFCTFNGLMLTAAELLLQGAHKVGILDLDHHYGNGTAAIIDWLVATGRAQQDQFHHYTVGGDQRFNQLIGKSNSGDDFFIWAGGDATERWLRELPSILNAFAGCDVVLFQAGADPHVDDPCHQMIANAIGAEVVGALTNKQFAQRDRLVFETMRDLKIPVTWNLAGGYQIPLQKVLDIHTQTLDLCLEISF